MKGSYVADLVTQNWEMELSIGDTIQVGTQFLTVIDIEGDEILFQLDSEKPKGPKSTSNSANDAQARSCR